MNIDFHYGVIFILARTAGLTRDEAQTVAHACQYVDDATTDGLLKFRDGQRFERFASAHGMIDYRNRINEDNRESWIPFHFVPGGDGATFEDRLVCRPNSAIAQALVCDALARAPPGQRAASPRRDAACLRRYLGPPGIQRHCQPTQPRRRHHR